MIGEMEHSFDNYLLSTYYVPGFEDTAMKRQTGICPKVSSLRSSREVGIDSGEKGNTVPQTRGQQEQPHPGEGWYPTRAWS